MSGCFFLIEKKEKVLKRFLILALTAVAYAAGSLIPFEPSKDADGCYVISTAKIGFPFKFLAGLLQHRRGLFVRNAAWSKLAVCKRAKNMRLWICRAVYCNGAMQTA